MSTKTVAAPTSRSGHGPWMLWRMEEIRNTRGWTKKELARRMDTSDVNIGRWEREPNRVGLPEIERIAKGLECSIPELFGLAEPSEDFRLVGAYDLSVSAGPGAVVAEDRKPLYSLAFRAEWLSRITSASDEDLAVIMVDGDSMEPTLHPGDTILVDLSQRDPRRAGVYVIRWDDMLNVKRISVNERARTITVSSDNRDYAPYDAVPEDISVVGRVVWIGRRV